jgi:hypothetical protein
VAAYGDVDPGDYEPVDYEEVLGRLDEEDIASYTEVVEAREDVELLGGYVVVELDDATAEALVTQARERGVDPSRLASDILRSAMTEGI